MSVNLEDTVSAIARVLDYRTIGVVEALYRNVSPLEPTVLTECLFNTHTRDRTWSITNLRDGSSTSMTQDGVSEIRDSEGAALQSTVRPSIAPTAVRLCFPLDLPVWGRRRDDWTFDGAQSTDHGYDLLLSHRTDPELTGSPTLDRTIGLLVNWRTWRKEELINESSIVEIVRPRKRREHNFGVPMMGGEC